MEFGKFRTCDWLLIGAGAVMLVFGMALNWWSADISIGTISGGNAFEYFFTGGIAYLLVVAAGVVTFLLAGRLVQPGTAPWPVMLLAGTGLATLLMLVRLLIGADTNGIDLSRGPGMYVAFLAAAVALAGAVINFTSAGGTLKDLTDVDKLRGSFQARDDSAAPPPPPPPGTPPPPPPPPRV